MCLKLLHIASFKGNIGDIINHEGFYRLLHDVSDRNGVKISIDQIEIRRFYRNAKDLQFDSKMLDKINSYDGLIIGGGGFFDVYWDYSNTGTTLNMSPSFVQEIKIPVLINAIGVHIDYNQSEAMEKFCAFFKTICNKENWNISLRNDGSMKRLESIVGYIPSKVISVPDNGFFFEGDGANKYATDHRKEKIAIAVNDTNEFVGLSITNDLFTEKFNGSVSTQLFNDSMVSICHYILEKGRDIMFFLHAPQDIEVLHYLYTHLEGSFFRNRIRIAPYDVYSTLNAKTFDYLYSCCKYIIAMRFHANVIAIKNNIPVVGLSGHEQIKGLYDEMGISEQCVVVNNGFESRLEKHIDNLEVDSGVYGDKENEVMKSIVLQSKLYCLMLDKWLTEVDKCKTKGGNNEILY